MATADFRVVFHHLKNGKPHPAGQDQKLITCTVDGEGRPIYNDLISRLTSNGKLAGDAIQVFSHVRLDKDQDNAVNILT